MKFPFDEQVRLRTCWPTSFWPKTKDFFEPKNVSNQNKLVAIECDEKC